MAYRSSVTGSSQVAPPLAVVFEQGKVAHHVVLGGAVLVLPPGEVQTGVGGMMMQSRDLTRPMPLVAVQHLASMIDDVGLLGSSCENPSRPPA